MAAAWFLFGFSLSNTFCNGFFGYVIVGAVVGFLVGLLMKGRDWGLIGDVVVGSLSALIGGLLFGGGLGRKVVVALVAVITLMVFRGIKKA